jgi:ANTAR domain
VRSVLGTRLPPEACRDKRRRGLDDPHGIGAEVFGVRPGLCVRAERLGEGQPVAVRRRLMKGWGRHLRPSRPEPRRGHASRLLAGRLAVGSAGYRIGVGETGRVREDIARATGIAMERYSLTESGAVALLTRLAKRREVALGVIALAIIAASRRRAD